MGDNRRTLSFVIAAFCAGLASAVFLLPLWIRPFFVAAAKGSPSDWIGFAGNFGAAAMTIVAAIVAWFAVQRQIDEGRHRRQVQQEEAKYAAVLILTQPVHAASTVLNAARRALQAETTSTGAGSIEAAVRPLQIRDALERYKLCMTQLKSTLEHFAISQAWQELNINDRSGYLVIVSTLHTIVNIHEHPPPLPHLEVIRNQSGSLGDLAKYLRAFDTELADVYERDSRV